MGFFRKINKIDKLLTTLTRQKERKSPISGMKQAITTDPANIKYKAILQTTLCS